ncbi:MAG: hypothetical protein AAB858_03075 [Patescibacteria group bacterium]
MLKYKGSSGQSPEVLSELASLPPQADGRAARYSTCVGSSSRKCERLPARVYAQARRRAFVFLSPYVANKASSKNQ